MTNEAIRVKALEWQGEPYLHDGKRYVETVCARTPIEYTLIEEAPGRWKCFRPAGTWDTLEEAKSACQADFARRVGACVEVMSTKPEKANTSPERVKFAALQARCDKLEAAARDLLDNAEPKWGDKVVVHRSVIEAIRSVVDGGE